MKPLRTPVFTAGDLIELSDEGRSAGLRIGMTQHGKVVMPRDEMGIVLVRFHDDIINTLIRSDCLKHSKVVAKPD